MNVAAAPVPSAMPVADGSAAAAGPGAAVTGFDALLALVDAAVDSDPTAPTALAPPPADEADPAAAPSDALMAALAAMMAPAAPPADTKVVVSPAADLATPPPPAGFVPPPAAGPAPDTEPAAGPQPQQLAKAGDAAELALDLTNPPPPAARLTGEGDKAAPAAPAPPAVSAPPAPRETAKAEAPARSPAPPTDRHSAPASAKPVETETAEAAANVTGAPGAGRGATGQETAQAEVAAPGAAPASHAAASTPPPTRMSDMRPPVAEAAPLVRGSPETVAKMSADILKKLDGRSTRFEIALDPLGLGRVDVKMEIGAGGQVTANLSFDTAHAAAELRGRAGELRHALQQAGFDLPENALSFDVGSQARDDGRGAQTAWDFEDRGQGRGAPGSGRAFEAILAGAETLASDLSIRPGAARAEGVDIRI